MQPSRPFRFSSTSDESLVKECLKGNEAAWNALLLKYRNLIYSIPLKHGLSRDDANDIYQQVCMQLLRSLGELRDYRSLPAWLITTTMRLCSGWISRNSGLNRPLQGRTGLRHLWCPIRCCANWNRSRFSGRRWRASNQPAESCCKCCFSKHRLFHMPQRRKSWDLPPVRSVLPGCVVYNHFASSWKTGASYDRKLPGNPAQRRSDAPAKPVDAGGAAFVIGM